MVGKWLIELWGRQKTINADLHLDERFAHSPDVSGFRYVFSTELARGTLYVSKETVGDHPPEAVKLVLRFKK